MKLTTCDLGQKEKGQGGSLPNPDSKNPRPNLKLQNLRQTEDCSDSNKKCFNLMFPITPTSSLSFPSTSTSFRCLAASDLPSGQGPSFLRWPHFPLAADISIRVGPESSDGPVTGAAGIGNGGVKVNAKEKKWSRNRESYLTDDSDPLPLPMTYPDSSPVSPQEIEKRLQCDPIFEVFN